METNVKLECPNCGSQVDVNDLLVSQFRDSIKKDLNQELQEREAELQDKQDELHELTVMFEQEKLEINRRVQDQVKSQLTRREEQLKEKIRFEIEEEKQIQLQELENELIQKSHQLRSMNQTKAQLSKLQRELEEQETRIVMEKEEELNERLESAKESIRINVEQENLLRLKEKEKLISDLKIKLDEATRKVNQGSMQLQGQVQELAILDMLIEAFPYDSIEQSKTGANGADLLQIIRTKKGSEVGSIYYESKRTQSFSDGWISKFKKDNLSKKADVLVLVSQVLPRHIERYGLVDDVWVCHFDYVKELALVLRYGLLKVYSVLQYQEGAKDKSQLLYQYITSSEFKNIFESIISGFKNIQDSHLSEQLKIKRLWIKQEKELTNILNNLVEHYGSIQEFTENGVVINMFEFLDKVA